MLVGLLQDAEGNRFTPSHTLKNGKRYRYYVCQTTIDGCGAPSKPARLPANDVEKQVSLRLQSFLHSAKEVMDELSLPGDLPARTQQLIASAMKQSEQLRSASPAAVQEFVRKVVRRILVQPNGIEVEVSKKELRAELTGDHRASSGRTVANQQEQGPGDVIRLAVEAGIKRCGGEMRLVVAPDLAGQVRAHPVASPLKALARGRQWYEWVVAGEVAGRRSIAQKLGLDERYVSRVLECAFLAPDILEAILDGRQPSNLTFEKLTRRLPLNWLEERKHFGFLPLAPTAIDRLSSTQPCCDRIQGIAFPDNS